MRKFELTSEHIVRFGKKLFRIKALISFGDIDIGETGGYIEKEENINHSGDAWVYGNAIVYGNARVYGDARVFGNAIVYGNAIISGNAWVYGDARVYGNAIISGNAWVSGNAWIYRSTHIIQIGAIGSRNGFTTFFRTKTKQILVNCGCFQGGIDEFELAIAKTHIGTKHEQSYMLAIQLAKAQIDLSDN